MKYLPVCTLLLLSPLTYAQAQEGSLQGLIAGTLGFINEVLIPFTLGIAFLIFLINAVRFFIIGGDNTESQENARSLALYGVGAFVLILSLWGIVNLFTNGIGLNNDPCMPTSDYVQDRYGDRSRTTCPQPQNIDIDTSNFGQDIPGFIPPGGVVGSPTPTGPGAVIPGRDTSPTSPTSSPVSFTPDGAPLGYNYSSVKSAQTAIKSKAATYFSSTINTDFGYNMDLVTPLFADLNKTTSDPISEIERLKAAVRLGEIGAIPKSLVTDYITTYNTYAQAAGTESDRPMTLTSIKQSLASPIPPTLVSRRNQTRQQVIDALTASNVSNNTNHDVDSIITKLYNNNTTPEMRYKAIVSLYNPGTNDVPAVFTENVRSQALLFDRLLADINAEKIYAGDLNLGF